MRFLYKLACVFFSSCSAFSLQAWWSAGVRNYCGIDFPEGLIKNQKLAENVHPHP